MHTSGKSSTPLTKIGEEVYCLYLFLVGESCFERLQWEARMIVPFDWILRNVFLIKLLFFYFYAVALFECDDFQWFFFFYVIQLFFCCRVRWWNTDVFNIQIWNCIKFLISCSLKCGIMLELFVFVIVDILAITILYGDLNNQTVRRRHTIDRGQ